MRRRVADDRGFVLIAAVWLLLLAGAIVAVLMLRGIGAAKSADADAVRLRIVLDRDSIVQSVVADLLINGRRSYWSQMPAQAKINMHGRTVTIDVSSEGSRADLNAVDLAALDRALQALDASPQSRAFLSSRLYQRRAQQRRFLSLQEASAMLAASNLGRDARIDLTGRVTIWGGGDAARLLPVSAARTTRPTEIDALAGASAAMRSNAPIRIETDIDGGAGVPAVVETLPMTTGLDLVRH